MDLQAPRHVSIHAPPWGATRGLSLRRGCLRWFQSTHPRGVRRQFNMRLLNAHKFQSTHPRGVRPTAAGRFHTRQSKFQSTHPRGVRRSATTEPLFSRCFNPRTPVGCDIRCSGLSLCYACFNPRTPVGCDCVIHISFIFNLKRFQLCEGNEEVETNDKKIKVIFIKVCLSAVANVL